MYYLIHNSIVVDKASKPFPVSPEMQWVEHQDETMLPYHATYTDKIFTVKPAETVSVNDTFQQAVALLLKLSVPKDADDVALKEQLINKINGVK